MARSSAPPSTEPLSKGTIFHSYVEAIRDLWGEEGLRATVARLPPETAVTTGGADFVALRWYPTRYLLEWNVAVMEGPAQGDEAAFRRCAARSIDFGFGRVRRAFLSFATPARLAQRAAELWHHDHTHGELTVDSESMPAGVARVSLREHPFVSTALSRAGTSEVFRYILSLSRARNVRESHALQGDALRITLRWDA